MLLSFISKNDVTVRVDAVSTAKGRHARIIAKFIVIGSQNLGRRRANLDLALSRHIFCGQGQRFTLLSVKLMDDCRRNLVTQ